MYIIFKFYQIAATSSDRPGNAGLRSTLEET